MLLIFVRSIFIVKIGGITMDDLLQKYNDYIRLKNVEVGYTLPNVLTSKIKIERLRFYINGYNLLTIADNTFMSPYLLN